MQYIGQDRQSLANPTSKGTNPVCFRWLQDQLVLSMYLELVVLRGVSVLEKVILGFCYCSSKQCLFGKCW